MCVTLRDRCDDVLERQASISRSDLFHRFNYIFNYIIYGSFADVALLKVSGAFV